MIDSWGLHANQPETTHTWKLTPHICLPGADSGSNTTLDAVAHFCAGFFFIYIYLILIGSWLCFQKPGFDAHSCVITKQSLVNVCFQCGCLDFNLTVNPQPAVLIISISEKLCKNHLVYISRDWVCSMLWGRLPQVAHVIGSHSPTLGQSSLCQDKC